MPNVISPLPDAKRVASLLEREESLIEQSLHVYGASYRQRCDIEVELAEIRRLLVGLGLRTKNAG